MKLNLGQLLRRCVLLGAAHVATCSAVCVPPCITIQPQNLEDVPCEWREKILRIRGPEKATKAGFYVRVLWVMNQLNWAERHGVRAFVDMDGTNNTYWNASMGPNWWEHFFEPVSNIDYSRLTEAEIMEMSNLEYPNGAAWTLHLASDSVKTYNYERGDEQLPLAWYHSKRQLANSLIIKYIRVKRHIQEEAASYVKAHFKGPVLGVHIRGTDKNPKVGGEKIHASAYYDVIDEFLRQTSGKVFLATEDASVFSAMKGRYKENLLYRNAYRGDKNPFLKGDVDGYRLGFDVLMDTLILAHSCFLVKQSSAVSEFSIYVRPSLHASSFDFQIAGSDPTARINFSTACLAREPLDIFINPAPLSRPLCENSNTCVSLTSDMLTQSNLTKSLAGKVLRIRQPTHECCNGSMLPMGFFAMVRFAAEGLKWARRHGIAAFVWFDSDGNNYWEEAAGPNMWEYYFEPVGMLRYWWLPEKAIVELSDGWLPESGRWSVHFDPSFSFQVYYRFHGDEKASLGWYQVQRQEARKQLKHVAIKSSITHEADDWWEGHVHAKSDESVVLGLHLRGTDKQQSVAGRIHGPSEFSPLIDAFLRLHPRALLFVATDSAHFLREIQTRYGPVVRFRGQDRDEGNIYLSSRRKPFMAGKDALLDSLLLAKCDFLLKSSAAVPEFAIYWNPALEQHFYDVQVDMPLPPWMPAESRETHLLVYAVLTIVLSCALALAWKGQERLEASGKVVGVACSAGFMNNINISSIIPSSELMLRELSPTVEDATIRVRSGLLIGAIGFGLVFGTLALIAAKPLSRKQLFSLHAVLFATGNGMSCIILLLRCPWYWFILARAILGLGLCIEQVAKLSILDTCRSEEHSRASFVMFEACSIAGLGLGPVLSAHLIKISGLCSVHACIVMMEVAFLGLVWILREALGIYERPIPSSEVNARFSQGGLELMTFSQGRAPECHTILVRRSCFTDEAQRHGIRVFSTLLLCWVAGALRNLMKYGWEAGAILILQEEDQVSLAGSTHITASITLICVLVAWCMQQYPEALMSLKKTLFSTQAACLLGALVMAVRCASTLANIMLFVTASCIMYPALVINAATYNKYQFQNHITRTIQKKHIATAQILLQTGVGLMMGPFVVRKLLESHAEAIAIAKLIAIIALMQIPLTACL